MGKHVVHAHCYGIDADGVVLVHGESYFQLRAHPVSPADQDRLFNVQLGKVEHPSEGTDVAHHPKPVGGSHVLLDSPDDIVACLEADACLLVVYSHILLI